MTLDWLTSVLETYGEGTALFGAAFGIGMVFGSAAQRSQFCMRAATVELAERRFGPRLLTWLFVFAVAVAATQGAILAELVDLSPARQLAAVGSMSGAMIGGLLFGIGMILARGCASRLLVLAATGNLRAIVTGLVLTLTAQAALGGVLAPLREALAGLWLVPGGARAQCADRAAFAARLDRGAGCDGHGRADCLRRTGAEGIGLANRGRRVCGLGDFGRLDHDGTDCHGLVRDCARHLGHVHRAVL